MHDHDGCLLHAGPPNQTQFHPKPPSPTTWKPKHSDKMIMIDYGMPLSKTFLACPETNCYATSFPIPLLKSQQYYVYYRHHYPLTKLLQWCCQVPHNVPTNFSTTTILIQLAGDGMTTATNQFPMILLLNIKMNIPIAPHMLLVLTKICSWLNYTWSRPCNFYSSVIAWKPTKSTTCWPLPVTPPTRLLLTAVQAPYQMFIIPKADSSHPKNPLKTYQQYGCFMSM